MIRFHWNWDDNGKSNHNLIKNWDENWKIKCILNFFRIFYILQVAKTQKLQRFTVNGCVVICGVTAVHANEF